MRLVLLGLLAVAVVGLAQAAEVKAPIHQQLPEGSRIGIYCNFEYLDSAFYQDPLIAWGNAFDLGPRNCLSYLDYYHYGWGFAGPYDYYIWVFDWTTCTPLYQSPMLQAADAAGAPIEEIVYLCDFGWYAAGPTFIGIEPLSCLAPDDCYPDIMFDYTDPIDGCGAIVYPYTVPPECYTITAGGIPLDFLLGVIVDECPPPIATESTTWGAVKGLYK